jgi:hypothetical protein
MPQMPYSVYNPTYLVTQSNGLFTQHQNQLQLQNKQVPVQPIQPVVQPEQAAYIASTGNGFIGGMPAAQGQIVFNSYAYTEPVSPLNEEHY